MNQKPKGRRTNGIDDFMLTKAANELLEEMEKNGWNQGEVESFPKILETEIKKNSERLAKTKPFTVAKII